MPKLIDLTGQRFGRLTVITREGTIHGGAAWKCKCDCGNTVVIRSDHLKSVHTTSCGCACIETNAKRLRKHGEYGTRLYQIWHGMISRCSYKKQKHYGNYGGRGITVCEEWRDFVTFRDWAFANGYDDSLTIDRIDANGNYCPENCRWATRKEQANNLRVNTRLTFCGETHTISEWADIIGVKRHTLATRLYAGWTIEKALTTPTKKR